MPKTMNFSRNRIKTAVLEKFLHIKTSTLSKKMAIELLYRPS